MKDERLQALAELLRAIAHPMRLRILRELRNEPQCVKSIQDLLPLSQANLSQHLATLRHANLVDYVQNGTLRCYYLSRPTLVDGLCNLLSEDHPIVRRSREQIAREKASKANGACNAGNAVSDTSIEESGT